MQNDTVTGNGNGNTINAGDGENVVEIKGDNNIVGTGNSKDLVEVTGDGNQVNSGDSNDEIKLKGDNNIVDGGAGDDEYVLSSGSNNSFSDTEGTNRIVDKGVDTVLNGNIKQLKVEPVKMRLQVGAMEQRNLQLTLT